MLKSPNKIVSPVEQMDIFDVFADILITLSFSGWKSVNAGNQHGTPRFEPTYILLVEG